MTLVTFNPEQALDRFFDNDPFSGFPKAHWDHPTALPKVNVIEKDDAFYLEAETPGIPEKNVSIEFHDGILTLKGEQEKDTEVEKDHYRFREFSKQSFERGFRLSDQISSDKVSARMEQGILKVTLPKKEQAKPKKIKIQVDS